MCSEVRKWREALRHPVNGYTIVVTIVVAISLSVVSLIIALQANRTSDRKLCSIAESNLAVYEETPPVTETGRNAADNWADLKISLHCPPSKGILK